MMTLSPDVGSTSVCRSQWSWREKDLRTRKIVYRENTTTCDDIDMDSAIYQFADIKLTDRMQSQSQCICT